MTAPSFIPSDYNTVSIGEAKQLLPSLPDADKNRRFVEGDHFQRGEGWVGPGPTTGMRGYSDFLDLLFKAFVSKNVLNEVLDRLVSAVIGREPRWAWVPRRKVTKDKPITDSEQALIDEVEAALTDWWDVREVHKLLKRQLKYMLWASQSTWRLYVPADLTDSAGRIGTVTTLEDALSKIFLDIPDPELSTVYEHPTKKTRLGIVFYTDATGKEFCELSFLEGDKTVVKILPGADVGQATNDFRKNITVFRVSIDRAFLTEQMRSLQRMLNMTLTLLGKGLVDNHFVEKIFKDILPPGHWEYEADGTTRKAFVPDPEGRHTGGRTDSYMQSIDYKDEQNRTVLASGDVVIRDPLDPTGTIKGSEYWYQALLEEARQDFVLINQSSAPSGKSREESRSDFAASGEDTQMQAALGGRALLLTVVSMAEAFLNKPGKWTETLKPVFVPRPKYGTMTIEERKQNIDEAEKGFLSDDTAMALNGIDDVDAERALILASARGQLRISSERADVVSTWAADFPREVALHLAGFTDDEIKDIMKLVATAQVDDPGLVDPTQQNPTPTAKGVPLPAPAPGAKPTATPPKPVSPSAAKQPAGAAKK